MDNQIFPGGAFLDDLTHVCTLCGMLFNNAITLQHHMQLHILTANAQMLSNPPPDPGLGINATPNILDLITGVTQHVVPSSANNPLLPAQALFSGAPAASMPSHLISPGLGLPSAPLPSVSLSQPPVSKPKQKKSKSSKTSTINCQSNASSVNSTPRNASSFMSRETSSSTYISTFPKDIGPTFSKDIDSVDLPTSSKTSQSTIGKDSDRDLFLSSSSSQQFDPIEEALKIPSFTKSTSFDRQSSGSGLHQFHDLLSKDSKLFQPFVTSEEQIGPSYLTKSNSIFTADSFVSPVKVLSDKPLDLDILSTPQKILESNENPNLRLSPQTLPQASVSGDMRLGRMKTQLSLDSTQQFDKLKDVPTQKTPPNLSENHSLKSQFYAGLMDPLTISPKSSQVFRDKKEDSLTKMPIQQSQFSGSKSSSPDINSRASVSKELFGHSKDSTGSLASPKLPMDLKTSTIDSSTATVPPKTQMFGGSDDVSTKGSVSAAIPQVFGNTPGSSAGVLPGIINQPLGLPDPTNPLASFSNGTGYFNALTQKLINPGLNIGADFNKPSTSSLNYGSDGSPKGKSYFENGILINQDYDKISDTNEDDDLEQLMDDITTKDDNIDTKGYSEIEDLLNEFNEQHPEDSKNRNQMDDFLNDVLNESSRLKVDTKTDGNVVSDDVIDVTKSAITEILEKEKEIIDKESKMLESARLKASELSVDEDDVSISVPATTAGSATATFKKSTSTGSLEDANTTVTDASKLEHKKEDDIIDEIPKVGKLMKIRKYFQIQEQKKKEQTQSSGKDAVAEIKIREKEPVVEEKPQTILVQVSKRKKIEYGPYINRQSLLEGKPKTNDTEKSPPKVFRPKPKPQVPVRRTFNLRTRTTKTDFASLANNGSKTPEVKKTDEKSNVVEKNKAIKEDAKEDVKEDDKNEKETEKEKQTTEFKEESKINTRNNDKVKKEADKPANEINKTKSSRSKVETEKSKAKNESEVNQSKDEIDTSKNQESENDNKKENKPNLRTRSGKVEIVDNDGKNLRKRLIKSPSDGSKVKVVKVDISEDSKPKSEIESEEKITRKTLRSKQKTTPEKADIKMCSVNLGENLTESKIKAAAQISVSPKQTSAKSKEYKDKEKTIEDKSTKTRNKESNSEEKERNIFIDIVSNEENFVKQIDGDVNESSGQSITTCIKPGNEAKSKSVQKKMPKPEGFKYKSALRKATKTEPKQSLLQTEAPNKEDNSNKGNNVNIVEGEANNMTETEIISDTKKALSDETESKSENVTENKINELEKEPTEHKVESHNVSTDIKEDKDLVKPEKRLTLKLKLGSDVKKSLHESRLKSKRRKSNQKSNSNAKLEKRADDTLLLDKTIKDRIEATRKNIEKYRIETMNELDENTRKNIEKYRIETMKELESVEINHELQRKETSEVSGATGTCEMDTSEDIQFYEKTIIDSFEIKSADIDIVESDVVMKQIGSCDIEKEKSANLNETITEDSVNENIIEQEVKESIESKSEKKVKHSVENEFQRLVDEAMAEVKKAHEKGESDKPERYVNLRKRLNEAIKYNVDDSDDENELKSLFLHNRVSNIPKPPKKVPKLSETFPKASAKNIVKSKQDLAIAKPSKKDVDVYDFTDDEEETPAKLSFKPKYVSNVKMFGQNKIPFVSKPMVIPTTAILSPTMSKVTDTDDAKQESESEDLNEESTGKTVEPLKINLTKIIPYKEKKHKHKKKKRKKDRDKRHFEATASRTEMMEIDAKTDDINEINEQRAENETCPQNMTGNIDSDSNETQGEDLEGTAAKNSINKKQSKLKTKKHICTFCNQGFGQKCDLRKHLMIHTGERPWPCEICDKKFQRKTDLVKHTRTHTGEKPYACEFCDKRVSDKSQLNVHRRLHTGDRPYQCTKCGKGCITSSELTRHRTSHCTENTHDCILCKKTFKIKEYLGLHMKLHYRSRGKLYKCEKCVLGFDKKTDLEMHTCASSATTLYICSECYEEFSDETTYAEHIKTHDLDVFSCNMCTHIFEDKFSLETHLCNLGVTDTQTQLQCDICDQTFVDQDALSQHVSSHDDDTGSFMCDLCSAFFSVRKDLNIHCKKHEDICLLSCDNCGEVFDETSAKVAHEKKCGNDVVKIKSVSPSEIEHDVPEKCDLPADVFHMDTAKQSKRDKYMKEVNNKPGNETRASVISGNFRHAESVSFREHKADNNTNTSKSLFHTVGASIGMSNKVNKSAVALSDIKPDIFESSEFSNSPDFSSLTDDNNINIGPFDKLSSVSNRRPNEASNICDKTSDKSPTAPNENCNTNFGRAPNVDIPVGLKREKQFQNVNTHLHSSQNIAQNPQDFRWSGSYQISATDYVNSLLNKMGSGEGSSASGESNKSFGNKTDVIQTDLPKNLTHMATNRTENFKDNIENHSKSDIFSEFDFPLSSQKAEAFPNLVSSKTGLQSKYSGTGDVVAFQGLDPNLYSLSRSRQHFQEKPEFSSFSNSFLSTFPQASLYNSNSSNSLFGPSGHDMTKRASSSSIFPSNQDMLQNNFFLNVEESIKGTSPTDKTDETTALLSNFDYGMN